FRQRGPSAYRGNKERDNPLPGGIPVRWQAGYRHARHKGHDRTILRTGAGKKAPFHRAPCRDSSGNTICDESGYRLFLYRIVSYLIILYCINCLVINADLPVRKMDDMVVACRGRALLCPLDPGKTEVIFIGRSRTPPLRDTIILLRTDKS